MSLTLQQVREVSTSTTKKEVLYNLSFKHHNNRISYIHHTTSQKIKLCRGQLFLNVVKIMLFISDVQYYVPIKLYKTAGSIHLFKITGMLMPDKVKLNKHYIWDILEVEWKEVKVTFNGKVINLPKSIS